MPHFFARIDSWWKAGGILVAAVTLGVTLGVGIGDMLGLPATVESNTTRIVALETARTQTEGEARRSRESIELRLERLECLVVAGRRNTPIEDCL